MAAPTILATKCDMLPPLKTNGLVVSCSIRSLAPSIHPTRSPGAIIFAVELTDTTKGEGVMPKAGGGSAP